MAGEEGASAIEAAAHSTARFLVAQGVTSAAVLALATDDGPDVATPEAFLRAVPLQQLLSLLATGEAGAASGASGAHGAAHAGGAGDAAANDGWVALADVAARAVEVLLQDASGAVDAQLYDDAAMGALLEGLRAGTPRVKRLALRALSAKFAGAAHVSRAAAVVGGEGGGALLSAAVAALAGDDVGVAEDAGKALLQLARTVAGASDGDGAAAGEIFGALKSKLDELAGDDGHDGTVMLRLLDVCVSIASSSAPLLRGASAAGVLAPLTEIVTSGDVLLMMNALELLPPLADTPDGAALLRETGVIGTILTLAGARGEAADPLIGGDALRTSAACFARAAQKGHGGDLFDDVALPLIAVASAMLAERETGATMAALDALVQLSTSSVRTWRHVLGSDELRGRIVAPADTVEADAKAAVFHATARLLSAHLPEHSAATSTAAISSIATPPAPAAGAPAGADASGDGGDTRRVDVDDEACKALWNAIGPACRVDSTMAALSAALRSPTDEVRCAVYAVLAAVAAQPTGWAADALFGHAGALEHLLDRTTESSKVTKEAKFSVFEAVWANSGLRARLPASVLGEVHTVLQQGPFYIPAGPPQVLTEG